MLAKITQQIFSKTTPRYQFSKLWNVWKPIEQGPPDPVLGVGEAFKKSTDKRKVNLSIGAYRDDNGQPVVLESIKKASQIILNGNFDNEYLPTEGNQKFITASQVLAFGQPLYDKIGKHTAGVQALSGTGALRIATEFCKRYLKSDTIYVPDPTWPNHNNIIKDSGLKAKTYYWYDTTTKAANFERAFKDIENIPNGNAVLLHACAHNPTGCDLNLDQWKELAKLFQKKELLAFFDMAYQGFTSGDIHKDAGAVRYFAEQNIPLLVCQSFAKNMGLYGQRIGALNIVLDSEQSANAALSQLKIIGRPIWSNPPLHGARLVETVLNTPEINKIWQQEVRDMAARIQTMRDKLSDTLKKNSNHDWSHIRKQQGMFAFTGLKPHHCERLTKEFHIYLLSSGRISVAGINSKNVDYIANAFHEVTKADGL